MTTNDLGQEILFKHWQSPGIIEFVAFKGARNFALTVRDPNGALAKYMGLSDRDDLLALGKAIVNAMDPEALVENQKAAEPEPLAEWEQELLDATPYKPTKIGDRVQWLGFVESNHGEHVKPVGALGTVARLSPHPRVIEIDWDDYRQETTYRPNVGPAPAEPERDLAAEIDVLNAKVDSLSTKADTLRVKIGALEAAADTEIRVGDTVRVEPYDWNIPTPSSTYGQAVTGKVISIVNPGHGDRYLVEYRSLVTGNLVSIYAVKATKVVSRG